MMTITGASTTVEPDPVSSLAHPEPAPYCSFCLRERPPVGKFHLFTVPNSSSIRAIMNGIFGFEFDAEEFTVCTPCWSLVQTVDDFRTCCIQVNELGREISRGLKYEDEWFSEGNIRAIYNVRAAIQSHLERIEGYRQVEDVGEHEAVDHKTVDHEIVENGIVDHETVNELFTSDAPTSVSYIETNKTDEIEKSQEAEQTFNIIECEKCLNWFMTTAQIEYHLSRCHGPKKPIEEALYVHTCHLCQENFNRPYLLESHLNWHEDKKPYKCRIKCTEKFYGVELRYIHERACPGDPRWSYLVPQSSKKAASTKKKTKKAPNNSKSAFECDVCGKKFSNERVMKYHRNEIHNPPRYKCQLCGRAFKRRFALNWHMRIHNREAMERANKTT
uniref:C2H2-type domain-containing protein n=1 Tax=Culex tarsalis TaxID=7177 RepID=A0A1Q3EWN6_CULTA